MSELLNSIIEADRYMVDEKKGVIKMVMDKKELEKELEIANIDAEELSKRLDKVKELEERVMLLHSDMNNFRIEIASLKLKNKDLEQKFRRHVNNLDAHKE